MQAQQQTRPWTPVRVMRLRAMWAEGRPGKEIASTLGGTTELAVNAKALRLGLRRRKGRNAPNPPTPFQRVPVHRGPVKPAPKDWDDAAFEPLPGDHSPVALLDLQEHHCRWPIGSEPRIMRFCGLPRAPVGSYCPHHAAVASAGRVAPVALPDEQRPRRRA